MPHAMITRSMIRTGLAIYCDDCGVFKRSHVCTPKFGTLSEFYCDRACHDGEPLFHDGDGSYYCVMCEISPDSDDEY
jgi:hypothetical protein